MMGYKPYTFTPEEEAQLFEEAVAFRETYGSGWPDEALAQFKEVSLTADRHTFERWSRLLDIMQELEAPKH